MSREKFENMKEKLQFDPKSVVKALSWDYVSCKTATFHKGNIYENVSGYHNYAYKLLFYTKVYMKQKTKLLID